MGDRWYDNTRIIWGLFATIGLLLGVIVSMAWGTISGHDGQIHALNKWAAQSETWQQEVTRRLERIEKKIDNGGHK